MAQESDSGTTLWGIPIPFVIHTLVLAGAVTVWGIHIERVLSAREVIITAQERRLDRIEVGAISPLALLQQELKALEAALQVETVRIKANMDAIQRSEERVDRLDTPLAKVVEPIGVRQQDMIVQLTRIEGRLDRVEEMLRVQKSSRPSGGGH